MEKFVNILVSPTQFAAELTVLIEYREHHIDHMIVQFDVRHRFGHMLQRGLIDRRAGNVVECQRRVHVVDVVEEMEKVQVFLDRNAASVVAEPLFDSLHFLGLLFVRVAGIGQQQFGKVAFANVALGVRILAPELQRQDLALQLMLELEKFLDREFLVQLFAEEEGG